MSSVKPTGSCGPREVASQPATTSTSKPPDTGGSVSNPPTQTAQESKSSQQLATAKKVEYGFSTISMTLNSALDATKKFGEKIIKEAKNNEAPAKHERSVWDKFADIETNVVGNLSAAGDFVERTAHSVTGEIKEAAASGGEIAGQVAEYAVSQVSPEYGKLIGTAVNKGITKAAEIAVIPTEYAYSGIAETLRAPEKFDKAVQTTAQGIETRNLERMIAGLGEVVEHGATIATTIAGPLLAGEAALLKIKKPRGMGIPSNRDVSQMAGSIGKALSANKAIEAGEKILGQEVKVIIRYQDRWSGKIMKKEVTVDLVTERSDGVINLVESKFVKAGTNPNAARTGAQKYGYGAIEDLGKENVEIIPVGGNAEAAGLKIGKPLETGKWDFRQDTFEY